MYIKDYSFYSCWVTSACLAHGCHHDISRKVLIILICHPSFCNKFVLIALKSYNLPCVCDCALCCHQYWWEHTQQLVHSLVGLTETVAFLLLPSRQQLLPVQFLWLAEVKHYKYVAFPLATQSSFPVSLGLMAVVLTTALTGQSSKATTLFLPCF